MKAMNPIIRRYCRSRLRWKRAIFWYLLVLIISSFTSAITYTIGVHQLGISAEAAARNTLMPLLGIQGFFVMFLGAGRVSGGIIQDTIDQTIDYQRLTPMRPWQNLLGYLFGLPVREYILFALTLPHVLFAVIVGNIPLLTIGSVYLAFFTTTCMYHLIGYASSMTVLKWRWSWLLTLLLVFLLNVFLPILSQTGLVFFSYLTIRPVIFQKLVPLYADTHAMHEAGVWQLPESVPFFNWAFSPMTFTLLVQSGLIITFATMVLRKWKNAEKHPLSKGFALVFLAGFITLFLGNLWPILKGHELPFPIFGERRLSQLTEVIAISLPMVYTLGVWALTAIIMAITTPGQHGILRGRRRALKLGGRWPGVFNDDAHNLWTCLIASILGALGWYCLYYYCNISGYYNHFHEVGVGMWRQPLALVLMVVYFSLLLQVLEIRLTALVMLLLWAVPVLAGILIAASSSGMSNTAIYINSISPFAWLVISGLVPGAFLVPDTELVETATVSHAYMFGLVLMLLQIGFLSYRWWSTRKRVAEQTLADRRAMENKS